MYSCKNILMFFVMSLYEYAWFDLRKHLFLHSYLLNKRLYLIFMHNRLFFHTVSKRAHTEYIAGASWWISVGVWGRLEPWLHSLLWQIWSRGLKFPSLLLISVCSCWHDVIHRSVSLLSMLLVSQLLMFICFWNSQIVINFINKFYNVSDQNRHQLQYDIILSLKCESITKLQ